MVMGFYRIFPWLIHRRQIQSLLSTIIVQSGAIIYKAVRYIMTLYTVTGAEDKLELAFTKDTPYLALTMASIVRILEKIDRVLAAPYIINW